MEVFSAQFIFPKYGEAWNALAIVSFPFSHPGQSLFIFERLLFLREFAARRKMHTGDVTYLVGDPHPAPQQRPVVLRLLRRHGVCRHQASRGVRAASTAPGLAGNAEGERAAATQVAVATVGAGGGADGGHVGLDGGGRLLVQDPLELLAPELEPVQVRAETGIKEKKKKQEINRDHVSLCNRATKCFCLFSRNVDQRILKRKICEMLGRVRSTVKIN